MPKPWEIQRTSDRFDCRIFRIGEDVAVNPRNGTERSFYRMETCDWVNVIAVTAAREVVLVEQYRHGTRSVTLEIPGGTVDEGEDPLAAGLRELREETGHAGERGRMLGSCLPNPAIQANRCYTVVVEDVRLVGEQRQDDAEDIEVRLVPLEEIPGLIADAAIDHALVITAFHLLGLERTG